MLFVYVCCASASRELLLVLIPRGFVAIPMRGFISLAGCVLRLYVILEILNQIGKVRPVLYTVAANIADRLAEPVNAFECFKGEEHLA